MDAADRIVLALALGDDDVRMFCDASGIEAREARQRVAAARQAGRRTSDVASRP